MGPGRWVVDQAWCVSSGEKGVPSDLTRVFCQVWAEAGDAA